LVIKNEDDDEDSGDGDDNDRTIEDKTEEILPLSINSTKPKVRLT